MIITHDNRNKLAQEKVYFKGKAIPKKMAFAFIDFDWVHERCARARA